MLSDNIKILRKKKGYSQETLAEQLHVVRQTISKWEKGISVPDAVMLDRMAELFEVPVSVLLGGGLEVEEEQPSELNEIAQQLAVLNDQLVQQAVRRRKVIRYAFVGVFAAIFVLIGAAIGLRVYTESQLRDEASLRTVRYECTLDGESYVYEASYNSQYQILYEGGDAWISNHVRPEQYEDVNVLSAQMQDYFEEKGGTCTIIDKIRKSFVLLYFLWFWVFICPVIPLF